MGFANAVETGPSKVPPSRDNDKAVAPMVFILTNLNMVFAPVFKELDRSSDLLVHQSIFIIAHTGYETIAVGLSFHNI